MLIHPVDTSSISAGLILPVSARYEADLGGSEEPGRRDGEVGQLAAWTRHGDGEAGPLERLGDWPRIHGCASGAHEIIFSIIRTCLVIY